MAYKKLDLKTADKITAADLAHIEDGISNAGSGGGSEAGEWEEAEVIAGIAETHAGEEEEVPLDRHKVMRRKVPGGWVYSIGNEFTYPKGLKGLQLSFSVPESSQFVSFSSFRGGGFLTIVGPLSPAIPSGTIMLEIEDTSRDVTVGGTAFPSILCLESPPAS